MDELENPERITPGTFDTLTANPPYSVASFKQHTVLKEALPDEMVKMIA